jgi:REP element-mobilizing transposase RayT
VVAAYHLIWTAYGWWLPNDPRGSSSHEIRSDIIGTLGELHHGRKKVQPASADIRRFYENARQVLKHQLCTFTEADIAAIANSFANTIGEHRYTCYACAIMTDHIHMLIRKHRHQAEEMIQNLQEVSRLDLIKAGNFPGEHSVWGGPGWKVFLDSQNDIKRTVNYIEDNPRKANRPVQSWSFVKVNDGWMPGAGPFGRPMRK